MHTPSACVVISFLFAFAAQGAEASSFFGVRDVVDLRDTFAPLDARSARCSTAQGSAQYLNGQTCQGCQQGYWCDGTSQHQCGVGYYSSAGAASCTKCVGGTYCNSATTSNPTSCQEGYMCDGSTQTPCGMGKYAPAKSSQCYTCPAGAMCPSSTNSGPQYCSPGYWSAAGASQCTGCAAGTFNNAYGATGCCQCCAGSFMSSSGQTHCQDCGNGYTSPPGSASQLMCLDPNSYLGGFLPKRTDACDNSGTVSGSATSPGTLSCPATSGGATTPGLRKRSERPFRCVVPGHMACPVPNSRRGQLECIDVASDLESCGGCMGQGGVDCTAIDGAMDVSCMAGKCVISQCDRGYTLSADSTSCVPPLVAQGRRSLPSF